MQWPTKQIDDLLNELRSLGLAVGRSSLPGPGIIAWRDFLT
jgi:hypothetical protein